MSMKKGTSIRWIDRAVVEVGRAERLGVGPSGREGEARGGGGGGAAGGVVGGGWASVPPRYVVVD